MKSFQSRSPIPIAIIGILVLTLALLAAYNTDRVPLLSKGTTYRAEFANAAGIRSGNPVKIAGVVVGRVKQVRLDGDQVAIEFKIDEAWVGDASSASIQLNTLLGQRYLAIDPDGSRELAAGGTIPRSRTETPYDIVPAINRLSRTVGEIDTSKLAASLDAMSETFSDTPDSVGQALTGLRRISSTISRRNDALTTLLQRADVVASTVADRDAEIARLLKDVNPLLAELQRRRDAIHQLLVGTRSLGTQLSGLVTDNQATLKPALAHLARVADVLERNKENLDAGIKAIGPYVHLFSNTVGVGRWFDAFVCGLLPLPLAGVNQKGCEAS